jgi:hypothetical protein
MSPKHRQDKADPVQRQLGINKIESGYVEASRPAGQPFSTDSFVAGREGEARTTHLMMASRKGVSSTSPLGFMLNPANMMPPLPIPVQLPDFSTPDPFEEARQQQRIYDTVARTPFNWKHGAMIVAMGGLVALLVLWLNAPPAAGTGDYYHTVLTDVGSTPEPAHGH